MSFTTTSLNLQGSPVSNVFEPYPAYPDGDDFIKRLLVNVEKLGLGFGGVEGSGGPFSTRIDKTEEAIGSAPIFLSLLH